ncbi:MAG: hypothetical protein IJ657_00250 [Acidaminococcaceae bacterium]|nr:hypothetical protein [Acidaminococcaceae bacterium]
MDKINQETEVTTKELAIILGLTVRRVQQLVQDGVFEAKTRGHFELAACVQKYIASLNKVFTTKEEKDLEKIRQTSDVTIRKSKADIARMEAEELQGKMHRAEDINALVGELIYAFRNTLLALPGRVAVDLAAAANAAECADIIRKETHLMMQDLMQYEYDPDKYAERVRERRRWGDRLEDPDDD